MNDTLRAALELHKTLNANVFPLPRCSKAPRLGWREFQHHKLTEDEIAELFEKEKDANIAVITGKVSNLLVVDADAPDVLKRLGYGVPVTPIAETARGRHYYLSLQNATIRSVTGLADGLDLRAEAAYAVAPPSLHPSGKKYTWVISPFEVEPAPPPDWLLEMLSKRRAQQRAEISELVRGVPQGRRNVSSACLIGKLLATLDPSEWESIAWPVVVGWNLQNRPPLDERQLRYTFDAIARKELAKRRERAEIANKVSKIVRQNLKISLREIARQADTSLSTIQRLLTPQNTSKGSFKERRWLQKRVFERN